MIILYTFVMIVWLFLLTTLHYVDKLKHPNMLVQSFVFSFTIVLFSLSLDSTWAGLFFILATVALPVEITSYSFLVLKDRLNMGIVLIVTMIVWPISVILILSITTGLGITPISRAVLICFPIARAEKWKALAIL